MSKEDIERKNDSNDTEAGFQVLDDFVRFDQKNDVFRRSWWDDSIKSDKTNNCNYCIHSHTYSARKIGMTDDQYKELLSVILMANKTNALATALGTRVDEVFDISTERKVKK